MVAEGADINAEGNYVGSVLAADLLTAEQEQRNGGASQSLYAELRSLGASPTLVHGSQPGLLKQAVQAREVSAVENLIASGYDWGRKLVDLAFGRSPLDWPPRPSEFAESGIDKLARPIAYWIDAYIHAKAFASADQTALDLFKLDESVLALKVLEAATGSRALDRQPGPPATSRAELVGRLLDHKHNGWARRVYAVTPLPLPDRSRMQLVNALQANCDFKLLEAAALTDASFYCLMKSDLAVGQKMQLLTSLDRSGEMNAQRWLWIFLAPNAQWALRTPAYRRQAKQLELLTSP